MHEQFEARGVYGKLLLSMGIDGAS